MSFRGYSKEIPGKILVAGSKQLTLEYIVDDKWQNFRALFSWMSNIYGTLNPVVSDAKDGISPSDYIPLRIYLLDNYKRKVIQFLYENTWIKVFNDIALDVANSGEIRHSFTLCYDRFVIEDIETGVADAALQ